MTDRLDALLGPVIDATPRPLPARARIAGAYCVLEPLHVRHADDLWRAAQGADTTWDYLPYGPFPTADAMRGFVAAFATQHDPMAWAIRVVATGRASGWITLMEIAPADAAIEVGHLWFAPVMQRTRAGTEAVYLLARAAMEELGYRRLVWKCWDRNVASVRAAHRYGFVPEGVLRAVRTQGVARGAAHSGRRRDNAMFSILAGEWPARRDALRAWLDPANFDADGTARRALADLRAET